MKNLKTFADARFKSLISNLRQYNSFHDIETLHSLRLDVKKTKALLGIIKFHDKKFKKSKHFKPFRNIFRRAGNIREPDVLSKLLLRYSIEGLDNDLARNEASLVKNFRGDIPFFIDNVKGEKRKLTPRLRNIRKDDIRHYLDKLTKKLEFDLTPPLRPENLHKSRKVIKEILCFLEVVDDSKKRELKFYKKLEEEIGQWHDKQVLIGLLKRSKGTVKLQSNALVAESKVDMQTILKLIRDFYEQ